MSVAGSLALKVGASMRAASQATVDLDSDGSFCSQKDEIQCKSRSFLSYSVMQLKKSLKKLNHSLMLAGHACRNLHYLLAIDTGRQVEGPVHVEGVPINIILLHVLRITGEDRFALHPIHQWTKIRSNSR